MDELASLRNQGKLSDVPAWPDGKRIAVTLGFDIDAETMWTTHGSVGSRSIADMSRGTYGPKQGVPRILSMLDELGVKATFFIPGCIAEAYPLVVREVAERGHDIGFHGWFHEDSPDTTEAEEDAIMTHAETTIRNLCGYRIRGHRGPGGVVHPYSKRLWVKHGYVYSSNWRDCDGPFIHTDEQGARLPLVELPKDSMFDDTAYDFYTDTPPERYGLKSPKVMEEVWKEEFDALAGEGRMINFVLHPQFMGRPSRTAMLADLIAYMQDHGAWIDTNKALAEYVLRQNR